MYKYKFFKNFPIFFVIFCAIFLSAPLSSVKAAGAPVVYTQYASADGYNVALMQGMASPNGLQTTAWFEYGTSIPLGNTSPSQSIGGGAGYVIYSMRASGLDADTTYYFRAVAQNSQGTAYGDIETFVTKRGPITAPSVVTSSPSSIGPRIATLNGTANPHGGRTTAWFEYGTSPAMGYSTQANFQTLGTGSGDLNYSFIIDGLTPGGIYYFRAVAQNSAGVTRGAVITFTTSLENNGGGASSSGNGSSSGSSGNSGGSGSSEGSSSPSRPNVTTLPASLVARNSALLNANVNPNGGFTTAWFGWGTTPSLGNNTSSQPLGNGVNVLPFALALSGLLPNTTYYVQAIAQNSYGRQEGAVLNFTTTPSGSAAAAAGIVRAAVITRAPPALAAAGTGEQGAKIILSPSASTYEPKPGEEIEFSVLYRNEGTSPAKDAVLKVILPQEAEYAGAPMPPSSRNDSGIEFSIGELGINSQGALTLKAKVKNSAEENDVLLFQAAMNYKEAGGEAKSVSVFLALVVRGGGNALGAFIGAFAGWGAWLLMLFLILLILIFIFLFFARKKRKEEEKREAMMKSVPGGRL